LRCFHEQCERTHKQSCTANNGWSSSLGVGWELTTHRFKKRNFTKWVEGSGL
jgi:hypothetical protein